MIKYNYDIIVIGSGPAGLTAALYALHGGKSVLIFEKEAFGGQISKSAKVENYPSIKSITGLQLAIDLKNQVEDLGGKFYKKEVLEVIDGETKIVKTKLNEYTAKIVIFALGAKARQIGLENEAKLIGRGLSYCALCDGMFFNGSEVAVVGGGSTAVHDALYMSGICKKVYLIHRRDEFRAEKSMIKKLDTKQNIELVLDSVVTSAESKPLLENITVKNVKTDEIKTLNVHGLFVAIGQEPQTKNFGGILPLDENGYVKADESCEVSSGIFVCGDCRVKKVRQVTTAVSDGTVAGVSALEFFGQN